MASDLNTINLKLVTLTPSIVPANQTSELHCRTGDLLGPLGLLVQGLLAFLAFTCLIGEWLAPPSDELYISFGQSNTHRNQADYVAETIEKLMGSASFLASNCNLACNEVHEKYSVRTASLWLHQILTPLLSFTLEFVQIFQTFTEQCTYSWVAKYWFFLYDNKLNRHFQ